MKKIKGPCRKHVIDLREGYTRRQGTLQRVVVTGAIGMHATQRSKFPGNQSHVYLI